MKVIDLLRQKLGESNVLLNEPMSKHTSFKVGGSADIFVKVNSIENLEFVFEISKNEHLPLLILGNGSNILVTDKGIRGIVCKIELNKFEIVERNNEIFVIVGAGNKNAELSQKLLNMEIEGFEFASRNSWNYWWSN